MSQDHLPTSASVAVTALSSRRGGIWGAAPPASGPCLAMTDSSDGALPYLSTMMASCAAVDEGASAVVDRAMLRSAGRGKL